jgi:hypothetical protein
MCPSFPQDAQTMLKESIPGRQKKLLKDVKMLPLAK